MDAPEQAEPHRPLSVRAVGRRDTRTVADGRYVVEVSAADLSGNTGVARFPLRVANLTACV